MSKGKFSIPEGSRIGILGGGKTGRSGIRFFSSKKHPVLVGEDKENIQKEILNEFSSIPVYPLRELTGEEADFWFISPGIPPSHPLVSTLLKERKLFTDLDLLPFVGKGKTVIAVTGTNGKSTVCNWIHHFLTCRGFSSVVGGNFGTPVLDLPSSENFWVLEVSSFQLFYTERGRWDRAVLVSFAENHLDWHCSMEEYRESKEKIFRFLDGGIGIAPWYFPMKVFYSGVGVYLFEENDPSVPHEKNKGGNGSFRLIVGERVQFPDGTLLPYPPSLRSPHEKINFALSSFVAYTLGVPPSTLLRAGENLPKLKYRLTYLGEIGGRKVFNDSKSTTPHATSTALLAVDHPVVLILGGKDKGVSFAESILPHKERILTILAYGEVRERIYKEFRGEIPVEIFTDLFSAWERSLSLAPPGSTILFSPGTSSFDQYPSYEARGEHFDSLFLTAKSGDTLSSGEKG